jgi:hypothetical protein
MDKAKIEKLLNDLTLGLKADPEMRLDVKSELRSHLDAKIEEGIQTGLSEKESEKQALKSFGDTIQISDGIADANTAKMSLKARLKVFAGILLVPAVIICALISFDPMSIELKFSPSKWMNTTGPLEINNGHDKNYWFFERYTPEEKLILYGDKSRKSKAEQQKAIWERFPENKAYFANYIITLLANKKDNQAWHKKIFSNLKIAEQKDPDNAFYNYISAGLLLEKACKTKSKRIHIAKKDRINGKSYKTEDSLEIKDRKLMDQALEEYLKGTQKKYYKTYIKDVFHRRISILGEPKNVIENMNQIAISASILLPHLNYSRNIAKSLWLYAELLQKEGKQKKALRIIAPWKTHIKQITKDSNTLIAVLVNTAVVAVGEQTIPKIYRKAGKIKLAENVKQELKKITSPVKQWRADIKKNCANRKQFVKAGILAGMLLPALGKIDFKEEDFVISNKIEYTAVEKAGVILLNLFFIIAMIGGLLTAFYWRIRTRQKALLLAPPLKLVGKVFLMGIIVPFITYILISISGIIGGHEYNLLYNSISLGAQFIILLTIILATIFILIRKHVHQRCIELDIPCPKIKKSKTWRIIAIVTLLLLAILACGPLKISDPTGPFQLPQIIIALIAVVLLVLYIVILIAEYFSAIFSGKKYALYYGALAKTLTPIFALVMIFMTLLIIPYLNMREADLISKDKVIYGNIKLFTTAEHQIVQRLKSAMLKALE